MIQRFLKILISVGISLLLVGTQAAYALNDGQQLVLESWSLVNKGYYKPKRFDEVQWKKLRQRALEKPINDSRQAYAAIDAMLYPLGDPYTVSYTHLTLPTTPYV